MQLKQLSLNEISKLLWINLSRENFNSLIKDVFDNLHNNNYKTTLDGDKEDLKNAENFLLEISTKKISENEACKLYKDLKKPDRNMLMNAKGRGKNKRNNILSVLSNIESSIFDGVYLNYFDKQSESDESIAERTKLTRQRFNEIAKKEKMIDPKLFREYFEYSSPKWHVQKFE